MATRTTKVQPQVYVTDDDGTYRATSVQAQVYATGGETFRATNVVVQVYIAIPPAAPNFAVPGFIGE